MHAFFRQKDAEPVRPQGTICRICIARETFFVQFRNRDVT